MKKVLTVLLVLTMFLFLFIAQNCLAQEDPFEIGKRIAMTGKFDSTIKTWNKDVENFCVSYNTEQNAVAFFEDPESGNGTMVMWIKDLGPNTYSKLTYIIENYKPKRETAKEFSITKEEAEKAAWRILKYFGYTKN